MASFYQGKYCPSCKKNVSTDKKDNCLICGTKTSRSTWFTVFRINGKQIRLNGFKTKREAEEGYYNYLHTKADIKQEVITTQLLFEKYKHYITVNLKPASVKSACDVIRLYVLPTFADKPIKSITTSDIEKWQEDIINKGFKFKYKSKIYCGFCAMMNYAIKHNYLESNVVNRVGNFKNNEPKKEMLFWTEEEFVKFYKVVDDILWKTFFSFLYFTGCRKGEALALNWKDIDFTNKLVSINKSINRKGLEGASFEITTPKNRASYRTILLPDKLIDILKEYKNFCKKLDGFNESMFVFFGSTPLVEQTIRRRMNEYADIAGVKQIRVHDLRHSHASLLINKGQNILIVSQRLGHSDITQTLNTYSHLMPNKQKEIIGALNIDI